MNAAPEPDDREALADLASRAIVDAWTDEGENVAAPCAVADAIIAAGFHRHPEPVKPSREDVAAAIRHATDDGADRSEDYADAVLTLWPGRSAETVATEADLAALPTGAVIVDRHGDAGLIDPPGVLYAETAAMSLSYVAKHYLPATVVHRPGRTLGKPS